MTAKPTHQSIIGHYDVQAWQNQPDVPIPVWVARNFHNLDGNKVGDLTHSSGHPFKRGQWVVRFLNRPVDKQTAVVLTDEEFKTLYRVL